MTKSNLIVLNYVDGKSGVRLTAYADTIVLDQDGRGGKLISAIRFGGYPEVVRAMSDAIYGGGTIEASRGSSTLCLHSNMKQYDRQLSHGGAYAVATLMASDGVRAEKTPEDPEEEDGSPSKAQDAANTPPQPRKCYIFTPAGDRDQLFEELDRKTAAPLIPEFRDYVLDSLAGQGSLRPLEVISIKERLDAWVLDLLPEDKNVVEVLERGLADGSIAIPGGDPTQPDGFENVENITGYLNAFGVTVADRIRDQFQPLFDPASEPLSMEVLAINDYIRSKTGYSLYDAQLAVAEAVKRQLDRKSTALIVAECGSGKTKIGSTAMGALYGMRAVQSRQGGEDVRYRPIPFPRYPEVGAGDRGDPAGYLRLRGTEHRGPGPALRPVRERRQERLCGPQQGEGSGRLYALSSRHLEPPSKGVPLPGLWAASGDGDQ